MTGPLREGPPGRNPAADLDYSRLFRHFHPEENVGGDVLRANTRRMFQALAVYEALSDEATQAGVTGERRDNLVMVGLKAAGRIDHDDPNKAREQYEIIRRGYDSNEEYWRPKIAQWHREESHHRT